MPEHADKIFLIEGKDLRALPARSWRAGLEGKTLEAALQTVIERYPEVLPGQQMDPESDDPPRFALLRREMPIGDGALDLLLVDQRAVLTLVETKLTENADARRNVIGQILDYAAGAASAWGGGHVREQAAAFWNHEYGKDINAVLRAQLGEALDPEVFWGEVEQNLRKGKIRLIVAGDELRPGVRRMIEYLNSDMSATEVYGLELRCYGNEDGSKVLVPHLIGQTQATADRKRAPDALTLWTPEQLHDAYDRLLDPKMGDRLREVLAWAGRQGCFLVARTKTPVFGLRGRSGRRIVTFSPDWIFFYLSEALYPDGASERDRLVGELKTLSMYEPDFAPERVDQGRNLARKLTDLTEAELNQLLQILPRFCQSTTPA